MHRNFWKLCAVWDKETIHENKSKSQSKVLTSMKWLKYFQKRICVVFCHNFRLLSESAVSSPCSDFLAVDLSPDGVSCLFASPISCSLTFSLSSLHFSRFVCFPQRETRCTHNHHVYGGGKAMLSHFLLFCSKLTEVAYLSRTEILVVRRWGVAATASFSVISFRLIVCWKCVTFVAIVGNMILR